MIIRQFRDTDAEAVSALIIRELKEINCQFYPAEVIKYMVTLHTPEYIIKVAAQRIVLVADEFDEIIGTATFNNDFFGSVFVDPDYHKKGVGRKLMESLEDLAKINGIDEVVLHSSINASTFYEKLGYTKGKKISDEKFGQSYEMTKKI